MTFVAGTLASRVSIRPGIAVLHSNKVEKLAELLIEWLGRYPLGVLEDEVVLVQSGGMGQWLKHQMARPRPEGLGIAAAVRVELPARFLWNAYREVLGPERLAADQPLRREAMTWRLYRLLPTLQDTPGFEVLMRYLQGDREERKRYQLAERLAALYDQYQVYRADWLQGWEQGLNSVQDPGREPRDLTDSEEAWQPELWRLLLQDVLAHPGEADEALTAMEGDADRAASPGEASAQFHSRASVHQAFMQALGEPQGERPAGLPRRVIVFGLSSLPKQSIEALAALQRHCQVLLCIQNPCRQYWSDIIDGHELLRASSWRRSPKGDQHAGSNPLLAALGKQGRDMVRMLDEFDRPENYRSLGWPQDRIDLFEDYLDEWGQGSLLAQVQQSILDLTELPAVPEERKTCSPDDRSLAFHIAHSPLREVEILHDQLLDRFERARRAGQPLKPRDIIVMVPDIDVYAPHIEAVFGRFDKVTRGAEGEPGFEGAEMHERDPRYIPYSLADTRQSRHDPVLQAFEQLLRLPDMRFTAQEVLDLLDLAPLRRRFGLSADEVASLQTWVRECGIRWGLDANHRQQATEAPGGLWLNTWRFGLQRMMVGYALGRFTPADPLGLGGEGSPASSQNEGLGENMWPPPASELGAELGPLELAPFAEVTGNQGVLLGRLCRLLEALQAWLRKFRTPASPADWVEHLRKMVWEMFEDDSPAERRTLERLQDVLTEFDELAQETGLKEKLPLAVVRDELLQALDESSLTQRFLGGKVTFCTLMPMRAIPFRLVCMLGLGDGEFPRSQQPGSFDLMASARWGGVRPGDRSRRQDDHYLFLEALLSARDGLYLSWVGRSQRDDSPRPASVVVEQLRDFLKQGWHLKEALASASSLVDHLTTVHPLQPFSERYFQSPGGRPPADGEATDARLFTYAWEWRQGAEQSRVRQLLESETDTDPLTLVSPDGEAADGVGEASSPLLLTPKHLVDLLKKPVASYFNQTLQVYFEEVKELDDESEPFDHNYLQRHSYREELVQSLLDMSEARMRHNPDPPGETDQQHFLKQAWGRLRSRGDLPLGGFSVAVLQELAKPVWQAYTQAYPVLRQWPERTKPQEVVWEASEDELFEHLCGRFGKSKAAVEPAATGLQALRALMAGGVRVEGWLPAFRRATPVQGELGDALLNLVILPREVKDRAAEGYRFLEAWVWHVLASAQGLELTTHVVAANSTFTARPLPSDQARLELLTMACWLRVGRCWPLPLAKKTGFAWLAKSRKQETFLQAADEARKAYEGNGSPASRGEAYFEPTLRRAYPTFGDLHGLEFGALLDEALCFTLPQTKRGEPAFSAETDGWQDLLTNPKRQAFVCLVEHLYGPLLEGFAFPSQGSDSESSSSPSKSKRGAQP